MNKPKKTLAEEIKLALLKGRQKYYNMYTYDKRPNKFLIELQVVEVCKAINSPKEG